MRTWLYDDVVIWDTRTQALACCALMLHSPLPSNFASPCGHWHGSNIPKYAAHEDHDEAVNCESWLQSLAAEDGVGADE